MDGWMDGGKYRIRKIDEKSEGKDIKSGKEIRMG